MAILTGVRWNEQTEKEYMEKIPFTITSKKNQILRSKLNKGCE
jgi:hypothetical protein